MSSVHMRGQRFICALAIIILIIIRCCVGVIYFFQAAKINLIALPCVIVALALLVNKQPGPKIPLFTLTISMNLAH